MENLGQLFICGIQGLSLTPEEAAFIEKEKLGGVILFSHNFESPSQLAELVNSIQKLRDDYPLFISVDQEGGRVTRFKTHFTQFPAMLDIATLNSPKIIFEVYQLMAKELAACGINLSFAPVCDVLTNPDNKAIGDRAFGSDAVTVEKNISAAIRGLQTSGLLSCAKHFPGHGGTTKDSHVDLPIVKTTVEELRSRELIPFVKASKARVEFMMMAHLMMDAIDDQLPATLSPKVYDFLRQETKFSKLVITDDMEMKAITDRFSTEEAAIKAITAGADVLLYKTMPEAERAIRAINEALKKRQIHKDVINEKLSRVEKCKKEFLSTYQPIYIPKISEVFHSSDSKNITEHLKKTLKA